ncbi:unnamed protein product [Urochloa humidicola]
MAALQMSCGHCIAPPASLYAAARPPSRLPILPVGRRNAHCFPCLKLLRPGETAGLRPRLHVRAQNHRSGGHPPELVHHFVEGRSHIFSHLAKIFCINEGYLYREAAKMSEQVCVSAGKALTMACSMVDSAGLNVGAPNEISMETIHMTLRGYVDVFVHAADDSYNRTVTKSTVTSFLGALRGLASISHILLEAALEALSHEHPRECLSEYAFNRDVKAMHHEYNQYMTELEDGIGNSLTTEACKLVMPTIRKGLKATESFVGLMLARRQRALVKVHSKVTV